MLFSWRTADAACLASLLFCGWETERKSNYWTGHNKPFPFANSQSCIHIVLTFLKAHLKFYVAMGHEYTAQLKMSLQERNKYIQIFFVSNDILAAVIRFIKICQNYSRKWINAEYRQRLILEIYNCTNMRKDRQKYFL